MTARVEALEAHARLTGTIAEIRARLQPDLLARRGIDRLQERASEVAHSTVDAARARPAVAGSIGGAALLFLLRRPIARLIGRLFLRRDETERPRGKLKSADDY